jgi:glycosyltransferase involved in cell wall biosynthesis
MSVSVVIPAWNAAKTLGATIQSALGHREIVDVIVVDDGSTDDTAAIARAFGAPVRVESIRNGGVSRARNLGFALATGHWVQFVDADDLLLPGTIERRLALGGDADVIVTDWVEFEDDAELGDLGSLRRRSSDWATMGTVGAEVACATSFWAPPVAVLYRREIVERIGGFRSDLPVIQDARHLFDAAHAGARFAHLAEVGAAYRVQAGSLSRRNPAAFWRDVHRNGRQIRDAWRARGMFDPMQVRALSEIFESAAYGLFHAGDAHWRVAHDDAMAFGAGRSARWRAYRLLDTGAGQTGALRFLAWLRRLRRALAPTGSDAAPACRDPRAASPQPTSIQR